MKNQGNYIIITLLFIALRMRLEAIHINEIVVTKGRDCYYLTGYDRKGNIIHAVKHNMNH